MQDGNEPRRIDGAFVDHQRAHLRVAVLLDDEHLLVRADEIDDLVAEREGAHAQRVEMQSLRSQSVAAPRPWRRDVEP